MAREHIAGFVDAGSFGEIGTFATGKAAVLTGTDARGGGSNVTKYWRWWACLL
jgi:acetyl-CoA carboxylase carboxyltransferase component